jgi:hypothetical protein
MAAGGTLGAMASALLRLRWNWRILVGDMLTAGTVTFSLALLAALFDSRLRSVHDQGMVFVAAGSATPAAARVLAFVARRRRSR